jgi:ribosomal protein S18 acetylase RimI-like enzyme
MRITSAAAGDAKELGRLFDAYRVFYERAPDMAGAEAFVARQIAEGVTRFFVARESEGGPIAGFVHLTPGIATLAMRPMWYLEDLFVDPSARRQGIGQALMLHAEQFARAAGAERLTLSTAVDNHTAQALYRKSGYVRDDHFWYFHRALGTER